MGFLDKIDPIGNKLREQGSEDFGKKTPGTPDFVGAAEATGASNERINTAQTYANRTNSSGPWGSSTWKPTQTVDPATGKPVTTWENKMSLDPTMQSSLDAQQRMQLMRSQMGEGMMGRVNDAMGSEMDYDSMPDFGGAVDPSRMQGDSSVYRQKAQDAVNQLNAQDLAMRRESQEAQLAAQGITQGSDAYNNAMRQVDDAESRSNLMAIEAGRNESSQMFQQDLLGNNQDFTQNMQSAGRDDQLRQMMIGEQLQKRGMPLQELEALMAGQGIMNPGQQTPAMAGKPQGVDYSTAMSNQHQANVSQANAQNAQTSSTVGAGMGLATMALMMY
jgi:hypothetical protein